MVAFPFSSSIAVGVGSNAPSDLGSAFATVSASIPRLRFLLATFAGLDPSRIVASRLTQTLPVGGPIDQAPYVNAVVLVPEVSRAVTAAAALNLLDQLQSLETAFGRDRSREQRWGPRSLDLDLLFWGVALGAPAAGAAPPPLAPQDVCLGTVAGGDAGCGSIVFT